MLKNLFDIWRQHTKPSIPRVLIERLSVLQIVNNELPSMTRLIHCFLDEIYHRVEKH